MKSRGLFIFAQWLLLALAACTSKTAFQGVEGNDSGSPAEGGVGGENTGGAPIGEGGDSGMFTDGGTAGAGAADVFSGGDGGTDLTLELLTQALTLSFNQQVEFQLEASGGVGELSWSLLDATALPDGLELEANGMLTGRPTEAGQFPLEVSVLSEDGASVQETIQLTVERKRWVAYIADHESFGKDELYISDVTKPTVVPVRVDLGLGSEDDVKVLEFSPDGSKLAVIADVSGREALYVVDPATRKSNKLSGDLEVMSSTRFRLRWAADSERLLFLGRVATPPNLYIVDAPLDGTATPVPLTTYAAEDPEAALDAHWMNDHLVVLISSESLYFIEFSEEGIPAAPVELVIPGGGGVHGTSFWKKSNDPRVAFFYLGTVLSGTVYVIDFRSEIGMMRELATIPGTDSWWEPSPDGRWLAYSEYAGPNVEPRAPLVVSIDDPEEVWRETSSGRSFWAHTQNQLFWTEGGVNPNLIRTSFGSAITSQEKSLDIELQIMGAAPDDTHLLLVGDEKLYLWDGVSAQWLYNGVSVEHSFAPNSMLYAYRSSDGAELWLGRSGVTPKEPPWLASDKAAPVLKYAWSSDSSMLIYSSVWAGCVQLFRVDALKGKATGQNVHNISMCTEAGCPAVKAFALQP